MPWIRNIMPEQTARSDWNKYWREYRKKKHRVRVEIETRYREKEETIQKKRKYQREYAIKNREKIRERTKLAHLKNPEKKRARWKLNYEIKMGRIQRLPCDACGNPKTDGHHEDYSKPLDVRWLCKSCHGKQQCFYKDMRP